MSIFEKLFKSDKFPEECNDGTIKIEGNKIICLDNHGILSCDVNIDDIQYAYVIVNANKKSFLFLFDHHQNSIPTIFMGFKKVYEELSKKYKFNDSVFFKNVNKKIELKKEIWRRHYEPTYKILKGDFKDYHIGFEIQSPKKQFISWETTYEELEKIKDVFFETSPYGQKISKFKYPIRIGNIILNDFNSYFYNSRNDVPILKFYTHCFDFEGTDKSYIDLKAILVKDLDLNKEISNYERSDQKYLNFNANDINLSICYTYNSDWQFNSGYTSLIIENKRLYPDFLVDKNYEAKITISDYLILEGNIGISGDYKRNRRVKRRPQKVIEKFDNQALIWTDDVNFKIGFSSGNFSHVFDSKDIKSFLYKIFCLQKEVEVVI